MVTKIDEIGNVLKEWILHNALWLRGLQTNSVADNMTVSQDMGTINVHYGTRECLFWN